MFKLFTLRSTHEMGHTFPEILLTGFILGLLTAGVLVYIAQSREAVISSYRETFASYSKQLEEAKTLGGESK